MSVALGYNSLDSGNRGLGQGWTFDAGEGSSSNPPIKLINHNLLTGASQLDAVEAQFSDGSSICYTHVGQTNTYRTEAGDGSQLTRNADGSFTLTDAAGAIDSFGVPDGTSGVATLTGAESSSASAGKGKLTYSFSSQDPTKVTSITDEA